MKRTLYDILGVPANATSDEIAHAFQERMTAAIARQADASEQKLLKEAHSILSQQYQRDDYDASLLRQAQGGIGRATSAAAEFESPPKRWFLWVMIGIVTAGMLYVWQGRKPATPKPLIVDRVVVVNAETQNTDVPSVATTEMPQRTEKTAEELFAQLAPSTAMVLAKHRDGFTQGSAVVIGSGLLITNCHVTKGSDEIQIKIGGEVQDAKVDIADEEFDLCRLSVLGLVAPAVSIGKVADLRTGQKVLALGAPKGLELTISEGIVSSLREVPEGTIIQTTAPISPGSSGGGLYNTAGELVGIVTLTHRYGQNLNFAVPADWISAMSDRLVQTDIKYSSAAAENSDDRQGSGTQAVSERILGRWHCFRPYLGRHIELEFQRDGTVIGTLLGQPVGGRYSVTDTTLSLYDSKRTDLHIEELAERRMVLSESGQRLACELL